MTAPAPVATHPSVALFIAEVEAFGGAERSLLALARWLNANGYAHHVLTYRDGIGLASHADFPLRVVELRPVGGVRAKVAALRRALRGAAGPPPIVSGYQPALHCTLAGARGFHTLLHDTPSLFADVAHGGWKQRLRLALSNRIIGFGLRSGGRTAVNSMYLQAECRRVFHADTTIVRMGGLRPSGVAASARSVSGALRLLSISRLESNKRLDWLLRALASRADLGEWTFDVVGDGSQRDALTGLAARLGLQQQIRFHGFVPDEALEQIYAEANLFLMPAVQGYGIPALEALGRGLPVLLHRDSGVSDILLDTPWAFVMAGGEPELSAALAHAMHSVRACRHCGVPPPELPTEEGWAEQVAALFGYHKR